SLRVCLRLPAYSASAKVICFIGKLGGWGRGILPNQKVFFRVSLANLSIDLITHSAMIDLESCTTAFSMLLAIEVRFNTVWSFILSCWASWYDTYPNLRPLKFPIDFLGMPTR
ncbi:hypothetical protein, partial [Pseudomonas brenneri]|uniref:hypothetical protein n=1 Tax=Pseudomonas brenneri TaxID=129817 RepID=UPI003B9EFE5D